MGICRSKSVLDKSPMTPERKHVHEDDFTTPTMPITMRNITPRTKARILHMQNADEGEVNRRLSLTDSLSVIREDSNQG